MSIISIYSLPVANIVNAIYLTGSSFTKINLTTSNACMCSCILHPHCLSISVMKISNNTYYCQLFATYPIKSSQLSSSLTSNVTIYTDRTLKSVYIDNGTYLSNPTNLFFNTKNPWIPVFKLYTGNNQSFLWLNSSNLTTLTNIPNISINQTMFHWFNILISQWNQMLYIPDQIAIAFIVNHTIIFDFLIFNASQTTILNWFSTKSLLSNQYWNISQYRNIPISSIQVKSIYSDNDCIRSFNYNFKFSTSGCNQDFYGFFFVYGGYKDLCIAANQNMSQVSIPSIYFSPTINYTNGSLYNFKIADGLMGFVR
ncbi:unnamed protein product [Rotaria sp. Silwood2]|nr:unnamed protein product [Rotaria sp. Silwood2]CAF3134635.1 unnamed protein product [Rotaria sp. Silwood2]CAF3886018.1 unnamed protein product [Rotaria sp. Silwood2]CAF3965450.1 unnamed protein product [Rotaria sp. Silwood2]